MERASGGTESYHICQGNCQGSDRVESGQSKLKGIFRVSRFRGKPGVCQPVWQPRKSKLSPNNAALVSILHPWTKTINDNCF